MRRPWIVACSVGAAALALWGLHSLAEARLPDRVWAYLPTPVWSDDPPRRVALERDGEALPPDTWSISPLTQTELPGVVVLRREPRVLREFRTFLGLPEQRAWYAGTGTEVPAEDGGRWIECVRQGR